MDFNFFKKNGYMIVNNFIEKSFCDKIINEYKKKCQKKFSHVKISLEKGYNLKNNKKFYQLLKQLTLNRISENQKFNTGNIYFISNKNDKFENKGQKWHIDGWSFKSFNQELAYTCVVSYTDIEQSSGTFLALDSIKLISNILEEFNDEMNPELFLEYGLLTKYVLNNCKNIKQIKINKGDMLIMHPFLLHSKSNNHSDKVRIIQNFHIKIKKGMNLNNNSLVEETTKLILNSPEKIKQIIPQKKYKSWISRKNDKEYYYNKIKPICVKQNEKFMSNDYNINEDIIDNYNINLYSIYRKTWKTH